VLEEGSDFNQVERTLALLLPLLVLYLITLTYINFHFKVYTGDLSRKRESKAIR
jgi:hypothetical protein